MDKFIELQNSYRETFDSDLEILELGVHSDGESGVFINPDGKVYDFAVCYDSHEAACILNPKRTGFYQDFATGVLAGNGINLDSISLEPEDAWGFAVGAGYLRGDAKRVGKCGRGWQEGPGGKCVRSKGGKAAKNLAKGLLAAGVGATAVAAMSKGGRQKVKTAGKQAAQGVGNILMGDVKRGVGGKKVGAGLGQTLVGGYQGITSKGKRGAKNFAEGMATASQGAKLGNEGIAQSIQGYKDLGSAAMSVGRGVGETGKAAARAVKNIVKEVKEAPGKARDKISDIKNKVPTIKPKKGKEKPETKSKKKKEKKAKPQTINVKAREINSDPWNG